ncbi:hypothetical protein QVD17_14256 [Tagetes erecta]|uniref:Cytochrome P450 n=1 Tax=Tagetes erecta TaxID=13708 RepID=A0AAD8KXZ8_TARER|nr:hypothetical protein QVD17_14256 [Tagetes erecta]
MDLTSFVRDCNLLSPLYISLALFIILVTIKQTKLYYSKSIKNLPPSPPQWPIIGNLHQVGDRPHVSMANLAKKYGPLMSLRFGEKLFVVASSPAAAIGVLKTHDQLLSARAVPPAFKQPHLQPHSLVWSECNQTWKTLKALCRTEVFSPKALEAQSKLRSEKISQLLDFLRKKQGEVIDIEDVVFTTMFNTLSSIILGKDLFDLNEEHGTCVGLKESLHKLIEYAGGTNDMGSFYPMIERFDLQGIRRETKKQYDKTFSFWEDIIEERRAQVNSSAWSSEEAHTFLDRLLEKQFSNNQINELVTDLFAPGSNTTTSVVVWAMSELVRHPDVVSKIEEEMKKEIDSNEITIFHLSKLTYLHACMKEVFRLHPPVPFLIPHMAVETCEVMSYKIPKNATIFVNVWAMGQDTQIWDDPLSFKPERFIGSKLDYIGHDFEFIPFGSGRRMCPGMPFGASSVELIIASLIREFTWALPNDDDPTKLDMNDKFGIALKRKKPLKLIFKQKKRISTLN